METLKELSIKEVKEKCEVETRKFLKREAHTTQFCYELFRRCFEDNCDAVIGMIHTIYKPLVCNWAKNHKYFRSTGFSAEEIAFDSLSHFIFSLKRHQFSNFTSIAALLSYWRKCVHTVIMTECRKNERMAVNIDDVSALVEVHDYDSRLLANDVWERVKELLPDPNDLLLARLIFVYDMKVRHIAKEYPGIWKQPNDVRVNRQRIKRYLQKDERLLRLLKSIEE